MKIHSTAIVSPKAEIGNNVEIGPYCVIHDDVKIGDNTKLRNGVVVFPYTEIGEGNELYSMSVFGSEPQDLKFGGERTVLRIGDNNVIREFCTFNRGTGKGGGITSVGSNSFFMAYSHIAHDCKVGSNIIFANAATLAGHVEVQDFATVGAFSGVHQFCRVGTHAFIGGYSVITQDALPYVKSVGNRAETYGINTIGLQRKGFSEETIAELKQAYKFIKGGMNMTQALEAIAGQCKNIPEIKILVDFINSSDRGVIK